MINHSKPRVFESLRHILYDGLPVYNKETRIFMTRKEYDKMWKQSNHMSYDQMISVVSELILKDNL